MAREWDFLHEENLHDLEDQIGEAYEAADSVRQIARNAVDTANSSNLIAQNAQVIAQGARSDAQAAQSTARAAQTTAEAAQTAARDARTAAQTANAKAEAAQSAANRAQSTANIAKQKAEGAEQSVAEALSEAANAQAAATSALAEAAQAIADAANALEVANGKQDPISAGYGIGIEDNEVTNTKPAVWATIDGKQAYIPETAIPTAMSRYSALITEAVGLTLAHRELIVAGGCNVNLKKTAAPGATTFEVSNTYGNRIACSCFVGGRLSLGEFEAAEKTVEIVSVLFANGDPVVPYSGGTVSSNNIIITTAEPLSETEEITKVRGYGTWTTSDILSVGQGNRSSSGKCLQVGQSQNSNGGNQVIQIGFNNYNEGSHSGQIGQYHINKFTSVFQAGTGHDSTNGSPGLAQLCRYSECDENTALAVGNGTGATDRSNAFEVTKDGGMILKSPNKTKYKITVDDTGTLQINAV